MKDSTKALELRMFIRMVVLGLKANPKYPGLAQELEKIFKETFGEDL